MGVVAFEVSGAAGGPANQFSEGSDPDPPAGGAVGARAGKNRPEPEAARLTVQAVAIRRHGSSAASCMP